MDSPPDLKKTLGTRLTENYEIKDKAANYRMMLTLAVSDQQVLEEEIKAINCYLFG